MKTLLALLALLTGSRLVTADSQCAPDFWPAQLELLQSQLDPNVSPCDDFYEYACGNWRASYKLRSLGARDTLTAVKADNKRLLLQYFEAADQLEYVRRQQLPPHRRAVVNFYNSCLDAGLKTEKSDAIKVYTDVLQQFAAQWPILQPYFVESLANASFNWEHVSAQMRRFGAQSLWRLLVQPNWQAAEQKIFYITPPTFELLTGYASTAARADEDASYLYQRYVKYLMLDLGVRVRKANKIAEEVVAFERALQSLASDDDQRFVVLKEPQSLETLAAELPQIQLREYFAILMQDQEQDRHWDLTSRSSNISQQLLIVADVSYLRRLSAFLKSSKAETIGKYFLVQFLAHFEVHLHDEQSFNEQKQHCLQQVHTFLPHELSTLFLELQHGDNSTAAFSQRTQVELNRVFNKLKQQFEQLLNATSIFDRDAVTKVLGLEKLRAMRLLLPDLEAQAAATVRTFDINSNYDRNLLHLSQISAQRELAQIVDSIKAQNSPAFAEGSRLPANAASSYGPLDVNAYYRLKRNAIEVPVGLLRPPLYDACLKRSRIYGSFVYILGHELLHGFDYDGLNYDKAGNVANAWGAKSIIKFGTKSSCYLGERYENAALTINENIADSEGLRLALETYLAVAKEAESPVKTANLRLFFVSFAQTWCGASSSLTRSSSSSAQMTLHAAHRERVNNVVGNFPEFAETFECREGSEMHPAEKCRIW